MIQKITKRMGNLLRREPKITDSMVDKFRHDNLYVKINDYIDDDYIDEVGKVTDFSIDTDVENLYTVGSRKPVGRMKTNKEIILTILVHGEEIELPIEYAEETNILRGKVNEVLNED